MELKSSRVERPLKRAKSTVCAPFSIETGVAEPLESVMLCTLTANDTTLGSGASVPSTYTEPVCAGVELVLLGALPLPELQPATNAATPIIKNTRSPRIHFIRPFFLHCLGLCCAALVAMTRWCKPGADSELGLQRSNCAIAITVEGNTLP